jgi:hypothetical protein
MEYVLALVMCFGAFMEGDNLIEYEVPMLTLHFFHLGVEPLPAIFIEGIFPFT